MPDLNHRNLTTIRSELVRRSKLAPEMLAAELERTCPYCRQTIRPDIREFAHPLRPGVVSRVPVYPARHGCPQEAEALERQAADMVRWDEERRRQRWADSLERAGLVGRLGTATFDSYAERPDWPDALHRKGCVENYAYSLLNSTLNGNPWLILHGDYGTGKSHLAAAVVRRALESGWRDCYFRVWPEYLRRLQATWDRDKYADSEERGETEADIISELQTGRLVVIDDLDKRPPGRWSREVLFTVVNHRYNQNLPTVLTFNYGPDDSAPGTSGQLALVHYLGEAVYDRLTESAYDVIEFDGPSYRTGVNWRRAA